MMSSGEAARDMPLLLPPHPSLSPAGLCGCRWPERQKWAMPILRSDRQLLPCHAQREMLGALKSGFNSTGTHRNKTCWAGPNGSSLPPCIPGWSHSMSFHC